jgi:hypothetical protein
MSFERDQQWYAPLFSLQIIFSDIPFSLDIEVLIEDLNPLAQTSKGHSPKRQHGPSTTTCLSLLSAIARMVCHLLKFW